MYWQHVDVTRRDVIGCYIIMVLYKVPFFKKLKLAKYVISTKLNNSQMIYVPKTVQLHSFDNVKHLKLWALSSDTIFGGTSKCELSATSDKTCMFSSVFC